MILPVPGTGSGTTGILDDVFVDVFQKIFRSCLHNRRDSNTLHIANAQLLVHRYCGLLQRNSICLPEAT